MRLKKICNYPNCGKLIEKGKSYCTEHYKSHDGRYKRTYWKKVRKAKIARNCFCELCEKKGKYIKTEIVHHIKDAQEHVDLFFDIDNLQSLCRSCHKKIHDDNNKLNLGYVGFKVKVSGKNIKINK